MEKKKRNIKMKNYSLALIVNNLYLILNKQKTGQFINIIINILIFLNKNLGNMQIKF